MIRLALAVMISGGGLVAGWEIWPEFINLPSLLITVGGTIAVTLFTFSWTRLRELGLTLYDLSTYRPQSAHAVIAQFKRLARLYHMEGPRGLEHQEHNISDSVLRLGVRMVGDLRKEKEIRASLEQEFVSFVQRYEATMQILLIVGRLLPAFGFIGTLIGLVLLLRQVSYLDPQSLPAAFSLAVLTTLYGALLANVLVLPLAAKLQAFEQERETTLRLTLEGVVLLARGESEEGIERKLWAFVMSNTAEQEQEKSAERKSALAFHGIGLGKTQN
jgi:chemotaxis protein MotA